MISFRPKKTGPRPLVTVREVYDKTCAVERAVGELRRTLDGRAAQRSHVLRYLGIAAVLTPPDVISQVGLAVPLILLYEISILAATWMAPKPPKDET